MATPELDMANLLLDCLNQVLVTAPENLQIPADVCLIPGSEVAEDIDPFGTDLCCSGLGWVRINDAYPSSNFPEPDPVTTKCFPVAWAQRYEVGILGCYTSPERALTCAEKTELALQDAARIQALKETMCCFGAALTANPRTRGRLWTIESIVVQGPRGTCISRVMSVIVQVPKCC